MSVAGDCEDSSDMTLLMLLLFTLVPYRSSRQAGAKVPGLFVQHCSLSSLSLALTRLRLEAEGFPAFRRLLRRWAKSHHAAPSLPSLDLEGPAARAWSGRWQRPILQMMCIWRPIEPSAGITANCVPIHDRATGHATRPEASWSRLSFDCFRVFVPAISICADTRVGNAVGKGTPSAAKRAMHVAVASTVVSLVLARFPDALRQGFGAWTLACARRCGPSFGDCKGCPESTFASMVTGDFQ